MYGDLVWKMRENVQHQWDGLAWSRSFFFGIQVQGIKHSTTHPVPISGDNPDGIRDQTAETFDQLLGLFSADFSTEDQESTWVDVGIKIQSEQSVIHWKAEAHHTILSHTADVQVSPTWTFPSYHSYYHDVQAGILSHAGGRVAPPPMEHVPLYVQWYCTKKAVSRLADVFNPALKLNPWDVFKNPTAVEEMMDKMQAFWTTAFQHRSSGTARLEARVLLQQVLTKLLSLPANMIEECTVAVYAPVWW